MPTYIIERYTIDGPKVLTSQHHDHPVIGDDVTFYYGLFDGFNEITGVIIGIDDGKISCKVTNVVSTPPQDYLQETRP